METEELKPPFDDWLVETERGYKVNKALIAENVAYDEGATKKGPYLLLDKIIKTGSRIAINISEKI